MPKFKKIFRFLLYTSTLVLVLPYSVFAATADLGMDNSSMTFSQSNFLEGQSIRLYVVVHNYGAIDALGTVKIINDSNGKQIGTDQVVSVVSKSTDTVFVDWIATVGTNNIRAVVSPWNANGDNPNNNSTGKSIYVEQDTDRDGVKNSTDADDDNDGTPDTEDLFPLDKNEQKDTDGDSIGDNKDNDDDNDGVVDTEDGLPLNSNETLDTDGDGIGNTEDSDDDGDELSDQEEAENTKTDPLKYDTDGDGKNDKEDAFPLDPNEDGDYDNDGIGNKIDEDADNDGLNKSTDKDDLNKGPFVVLSDEPNFVLPSANIDLDAGPSYDEDGQIVSYEWSIESEDDAENLNNEHKIYTDKNLETKFDKNGKYKVTLKVTDNKGESREKIFEIRVFNYIPWLLLLLLLIIALALYWRFKYTRQAKKPTQTVEKAVKKAKKATKVAPKKVKKAIKKSTNNKKKS